MARPSKGTRITKATVDAAVRDAQAKMSWEYPDPECAGLSLRVRGKAVTWSFRGPRLGGKNRRWYLGGHTVTPKDARQRASQVRMRIRQGLDPTPLLTEILTGLKPQEQLDLRIEERPSWEGEGDDVTRGYYDLDPRIGRKLEMMHWWTAWCDEQCALAIAADPVLRDPEALRQACYIQRYGKEAWNAKIKKTRDTGAPLWPTDSDAEIAA
jgi:hypothetical protein